MGELNKGGARYNRAMGETGVREESMFDLLNLIGKAIESLQQSIELFEASRREAGLKQLSFVILEIDRYLEQIDEDPLLKIATVDRAGLSERLVGVKGELASVIENFASHAL